MPRHPHRARSPGRKAGSRRRALRHPDPARGRELPDLRASAAARVRGRRRLDQAAPPRSPTRRPGGWSRALADAIVRAADEVLAGQHRDQFVVDVYQAGRRHQPQHELQRGARQPGQRAARRRARGATRRCIPNDHVNMAQSTNDVIPTAMRLATLATLPRAARRAGGLADVAARQGRRSSTTSSSRAAPTCRMRRRSAWARSSPPTAAPCARHRAKLAEAAEWLREMNIGGTAVGTGLNAEPDYPGLWWSTSAQITGLDLRGGRRTGSSSCSRWATSPPSAARCGPDVSTSTRSPTTSGCSPRARAPGSPRSCSPRCSPAPASCRAR